MLKVFMISACLYLMIMWMELWKDQPMGNLPVIVSTDAKLKKDKYEHIGMKHINTRTLGTRSFMYDLVREA